MKRKLTYSPKDGLPSFGRFRGFAKCLQAQHNFVTYHCDTASESHNDNHDIAASFLPSYLALTSLPTISTMRIVMVTIHRWATTCMNRPERV